MDYPKGYSTPEMVEIFDFFTISGVLEKHTNPTQADACFSAKETQRITKHHKGPQWFVQDIMYKNCLNEQGLSVDRKQSGRQDR